MQKTMRKQMDFPKKTNSNRGWQESENQIIGISDDLKVLLKNCFGEKNVPKLLEKIEETPQDNKILALTYVIAQKYAKEEIRKYLVSKIQDNSDAMIKFLSQKHENFDEAIKKFFPSRNEYIKKRDVRYIEANKKTKKQKRQKKRKTVNTNINIDDLCYDSDLVDKLLPNELITIGACIFKIFRPYEYEWKNIRKFYNDDVKKMKNKFFQKNSLLIIKIRKIVSSINDDKYMHNSDFNKFVMCKVDLNLLKSNQKLDQSKKDEYEKQLIDLYDKYGFSNQKRFVDRLQIRSHSDDKKELKKNISFQAKELFKKVIFNYDNGTSIDDFNKVSQRESTFLTISDRVRKFQNNFGSERMFDFLKYVFENFPISSPLSEDIKRELVNNEYVEKALKELKIQNNVQAVDKFLNDLNDYHFFQNFIPKLHCNVKKGDTLPINRNSAIQYFKYGKSTDFKKKQLSILEHIQLPILIVEVIKVVESLNENTNIKLVSYNVKFDSYQVHGIPKKCIDIDSVRFQDSYKSIRRFKKLDYNSSKMSINYTCENLAKQTSLLSMFPNDTTKKIFFDKSTKQLSLYFNKYKSNFSSSLVTDKIHMLRLKHKSGKKLDNTLLDKINQVVSYYYKKYGYVDGIDSILTETFISNNIHKKNFVSNVIEIIRRGNFLDFSITGETSINDCWNMSDNLENVRKSKPIKELDISKTSSTDSKHNISFQNYFDLINADKSKKDKFLKKSYEDQMKEIDRERNLAKSRSHHINSSSVVSKESKIEHKIIYYLQSRNTNDVEIVNDIKKILFSDYRDKFQENLVNEFKVYHSDYCTLKLKVNKDEEDLEYLKLLRTTFKDFIGFTPDGKWNQVTQFDSKHKLIGLAKLYAHLRYFQSINDTLENLIGGERCETLLRKIYDVDDRGYHENINSSVNKLSTKFDELMDYFNNIKINEDGLVEHKFPNSSEFFGISKNNILVESIIKNLSEIKYKTLDDKIKIDIYKVKNKIILEEDNLNNCLKYFKHLFEDCSNIGLDKQGNGFVEKKSYAHGARDKKNLIKKLKYQMKDKQIKEQNVLKKKVETFEKNIDTTFSNVAKKFKELA